MWLEACDHEVSSMTHECMASTYHNRTSNSHKQETDTSLITTPAPKERKQKKEEECLCFCMKMLSAWRIVNVTLF